jgi:hypothetical protein
MKHYAAVAFSCVVLVLSASAQTHRPQKIDPQAQMMQYYRQYPDRYIRISKESWQYAQATRLALHSFTLNNTAVVPYCEIEMRFSYQDEKGAAVATMTQSIPGILQPYRPEQKDVKLKAVPPKAVNVVVSVSKALVCR